RLQDTAKRAFHRVRNTIVEHLRGPRLARSQRTDDLLVRDFQRPMPRVSGTCRNVRGQAPEPLGLRHGRSLTPLSKGLEMGEPSNQDNSRSAPDFPVMKSK